MTLMLDVRDVGKAFRDYGSELKRIATWFGVPVKPREEHWVLRGISFSVGRGEAIGIVGQNGAGKSTLLKLITRTLVPTEGSVSVHGRIAAILELGMGFSPDLTGRQNVYHAAGLMGFSREQIEAAMPDIEAFAEIGDYFDEYVRTYSSGMQMRVAFSVATAFRPDILIVDEALSVGDAYFQHKCFKRIKEFRELGTSLLIVSHDSGAIQNMCDRAILLQGGRVLKDGEPTEVMDAYNALIAERENTTMKVERLESGQMQTISGTFEAVVKSIRLHATSGEPIEFVDVGQDVELRIDVEARSDIPKLVLGYMIKDRLGQPVFGTNTFHTRQVATDVPAGSVLSYVARFPMNIGPGSYSISTALVSTDTHLVDNYEWRDLALIFTVANQSHPHFVGSAWIPPTFDFDRLP
ncbi:lipopolysaccharide transport system ATP-binding protein [Luteibacter sp. UNC138MFCol5.1]|uniref:ABC transporter ATP-binding protein n=1 Tax=Luteibacter sp. UNC138MFCol5.1 TaxID=1502774 RepID=UPI0008B827F4|nr:ABC transporter ATP-binding protein [Luteibacter sp. UNC138MFCol5.1]SEP05743.1 lipopolysaccharide transport system ATP-binding protein [Luteibacter sp. UNC138MFCol5.1]